MGKKGGAAQTTEYSKEYSKKMADIAESQQRMAEEQWDMYKEHFQQYEIDAAKANSELLPFMTNATKEMFTMATEGLDTGRRQDEAEADVVGSFGKAKKAMQMEGAKYGLDPSSQRSLGMVKNFGLDEATAISGARTGARERADTEKFNRLATTMNKQPLRTPDVAGRAMSGMGMAASSYRPLATRVLRSEYQDNSNIWDFVGDVGSTVAGAYLGGVMSAPSKK